MFEQGASYALSLKRRGNLHTSEHDNSAFYAEANGSDQAAIQPGGKRNVALGYATSIPDCLVELSDFSKFSGFRCFYSNRIHQFHFLM